MSTPQKRGILERLDAGEVVIGDGGFVFALEKRGYVQAGPWTPETNVEHPSAGKEFRLSEVKNVEDIFQNVSLFSARSHFDHPKLS